MPLVGKKFRAPQKKTRIKQEPDLFYLCLVTTEISMSPPFTTFEDSTLIKLTLAGEGDCFAVLMDRHLTAVRRRIRSMVPDASDLDDLLQEVALKIWCHLGTFRSESSFRTWMTRVAINETLQSYRRERSRPLYQSLGDFDAIASPGQSPYQSLALVELTQAVRSAVAALPEKYRQVLILRDLDQLSARETAQSLHSTIPTVKTRLFRARLMLSTALQRSRIRKLASGGA
jgi:RNA polymerase sigma-70 factor (ECF subfamily)